MMNISPSNRVHQYATDVVSGELIASKLVIKQCESHLYDLENNEKYEFNEERADHCINFIENILYYQGNLIVIPRWLTFVIGCWAGWVSKIDGRRRYREVVVITSKSSLKSSAMAWLSIYQLIGDKYSQDLKPRIQISANSYDQGRIILEEARDRIMESQFLSSYLTVRGGSQKPSDIFRINKKFKYGGQAQIVASDKSGWQKGKGGQNVTTIFSDELGEIPRGDGSLSWLIRNRKNAKEFTVFIISNPSINKTEAELADYYKRVRDSLYGISPDEKLFGFIAELDDDAPQSLSRLMKPKNKKYWHQGNPGLIDNFPSEEYIMDEIHRTISNPTKANETLRMNFSVFIGDADIQSLISQSQYDQIMTDKLSPDRHDWPMSIGVDLSNITRAGELNDLTSIALLWESPEKKYEMEVKSFISNKNISKREDFDGRPWGEWIKKKYITTVDEDWIEWDFIAKHIQDILNKNKKTIGIAYDAYNWSHLRGALKEIGITEHKIPFYLHRQTAQPGRADGTEPTDILYMPQAITRFQMLNAQSRIKILKNPVTKIAFTSARVKDDEHGNPRLHKIMTERAKIDPCVAGLEAINLMLKQKSKFSYSDYLTSIKSGIIPTSF